MAKSTYFAEEGNIEERVRLKRQSELLNRYVTPLDAVDMAPVHDVIDIACGTGCWCIQLAKTHPDLHIVGIDHDAGIWSFAQNQAKVERVQIDFQLANALEPLPFPDNSFDLVHMRLVMGFTKRDAWPALLQECKRILRPGGVLICVEQTHVLTNNYEYERRAQVLYTAFNKVGYTFADDERLSHACVGIMLPTLFEQTGFTNVADKPFHVCFSTGTDAHESTLQNFIAAFKSAGPVLERMKLSTLKQTEEIQNYIKSLIGKPNFVGYWGFISAYGRKPI
jgi:SAM-dependent methyltransferase